MYENSVEDRVRKCIVASLGLDEEDIAGFRSTTPLFVAAAGDERALGLDSVAALEILLAMESEFGLTSLEVEPESFYSVATLSTWISQRLPNAN